MKNNSWVEQKMLADVYLEVVKILFTMICIFFNHSFHLLFAKLNQSIAICPKLIVQMMWRWLRVYLVDFVESPFRVCLRKQAKFFTRYDL